MNFSHSVSPSHGEPACRTSHSATTQRPVSPVASTSSGGSDSVLQGKIQDFGKEFHIRVSLDSLCTNPMRMAKKNFH